MTCVSHDGNLSSCDNCANSSVNCTNGLCVQQKQDTKTGGTITHWINTCTIIIALIKE